MWNLGPVCPDVAPLITPEDFMVAALAHVIACWCSLCVKAKGLYIPSSKHCPGLLLTSPECWGWGGSMLRIKLREEGFVKGFVEFEVLGPGGNATAVSTALACVAVSGPVLTV